MYFNSIQFSLLNDTDSAVLNISEDLDLLGKLFFLSTCSRKIATAHSVTEYKKLSVVFQIQFCRPK